MYLGIHFFNFSPKHSVGTQGGSSEYPQSKFWKKRKFAIPVNPSSGVGVKGYTFYGDVFLMHSVKLRCVPYCLQAFFCFTSCEKK